MLPFPTRRLAYITPRVATNDTSVAGFSTVGVGILAEPGDYELQIAEAAAPDLVMLVPMYLPVHILPAKHLLDFRLSLERIDLSLGCASREKRTFTRRNGQVT